MRLAGKAVIESGTKILVAFLLSIFFVFLAYIFLTDTGRNVVEAISAKVSGKIGLEPVAIPALGKIGIAQQRGLNARIDITPGLPACEYEQVELSAYNSTLPEGVYAHNLQCSWDLDIAKDNDANGKPDDDRDAEGCRISTNARPSLVKLAIKITGDVPGSGLASTATASISTLLSCACTPSADTRCSPEISSSVTNRIIKYGDSTSLLLPRNADVRGVHIRIEPYPDGTMMDVLGIASPGEADSYHFEGGIAGEFVIDGNSFPGAIEGSLTAKINEKLIACTADACEIPLRWHFRSQDQNAGLQIKGVFIPYVLRQY